MTFKPGQSGNPSGRPKSREITDCLRELLCKYSFADNSRLKKGAVRDPDAPRLYRRKAGQKTTMREEVAIQILNDAIRGIGNNRELLLDRIEGKVPQSIRGDDDPEAPPVRTRDETIKELARSTAFLLMAGAEKAK